MKTIWAFALTDARKEAREKARARLSPFAIIAEETGNHVNERFVLMVLHGKGARRITIENSFEQAWTLYRFEG